MCIDHAEFPDVQVDRNRTAGEKHREHDKKHEEFPSLQPFDRQRERVQNRQCHGQQGVEHRDLDRKKQAAEHGWVLHNQFIGLRCEFHRPEGNVTPKDCGLGRKGDRNYVDERQCAKQHEQDHHDVQDHLSRAGPFLFSGIISACNCRVRHHASSLPYQMPCSSNRRADPLAMTISTRPTTDWKSPTAVARSNFPFTIPNR